MSKAANPCSASGIGGSAAVGAAGCRKAPFLVAAACWLLDQWRRRAVIGELGRLNDHHLRDIGIERGEIEEVAEVMVRRQRARRVSRGHSRV